jgi:hypothetical protein
MIVCESRVPPWRDLSALGIVAKEQGSARCGMQQNSPNFQIPFFNISFTVLLLRTLMHEFARVLQAIIHGAVQFRKLPDSSNKI